MHDVTVHEIDVKKFESYYVKLCEKYLKCRSECEKNVSVMNELKYVTLKVWNNDDCVNNIRVHGS